MYKKIGSKYTRKYGKTIFQLAKKLNVSVATLCKWERNGYDVFYKAANIIRQNLKLQKVWNNMRQRCGNPNDNKYECYGGRGIRLKMDKRDLVYLWKRDRADTMKQPSIDRINSGGHYTLKNCRFIEMAVNRKNKRKNS